MNHHEIITKLIGPISPVGCSNTDRKRLENLKSHLTLMEALLADIQEITEHKDSYERSVKEIGVMANKFIELMSEDLTC